MKKWLIFMILSLNITQLSFADTKWNGRIVDVKSQTDMTSDELTEQLAKKQMIIFGEKHNTAPIQLAESSIIHNVVTATHQQNNFITAWEFLNYPDQPKIDTVYEKFLLGQLSALDFLIELQGKAINKSYIPLLETTKQLHGKIIGVNISRAAKEPVTKGGIDALDPQYLPPNFAMGGAGYHERFVEIMESHVAKELLENYYAAQCLTDDIMAYTLQKNSDSPLLFLISGSFHTDYFDGVVSRSSIRMPGKPIAVIRLIDAADYDSKELNETFSQILYSKTYGKVADYVYFVNEPT